ncbi:unannotated protein [freshwater metagenome]|uniref:Unannotated protein n=1 Tax=freshwater metagenome TaxID=449393 RepID=A0A6J7AG27_9ZZZZ|nr:helix-turn-helix domain-containing protein [Actinomycetota bacterium]MSW26626.1 helix-turn-helix domain-containing protein [Actinomycetota bacterium]MSW34398.1 helix-turn-helix domain-containing protein [Actinomycetota bacterium]MSX31454.1 helix-turn-helix domain-containing protein [Actinomycetota bacterium]MSX51875.1 helix-turn-helix domain-containing protein [Actinomycetota bacterium]
MKPLDLPDSTLFTQPTTDEIATRLRHIRKSRGWSLSHVESLSGGRIKAVVLGSYERSDRALSLARAIEIANIYAVPLTFLLSPPETADVACPNSTRIMIDLRKAKKISTYEKSNAQFSTFLQWIAGQRNDWNGEVLSIRRSDLSTLALITFSTEANIYHWMAERNLLLTGIDPI